MEEDGGDTCPIRSTDATDYTLKCNPVFRPSNRFFFFFYRRQLARCTSANKLCKGNEMSVENTGTITPVRPRVDS